MYRPTLAAIVVATAVATPAAIAEQDLTWDWTAGETLRYEVVEKATQEQGGAGGLKQTKRQRFKLEIREVMEDGSAWIDWTLDELAIELDMGAGGGPMGGNVDYDSERDGAAADPRIATDAAPLDETYSARVQSNGEVVELADTDDILAKLKALPMAAQATDDQLMTILKSQVEQVSKVAPGRTVEPAAEWQTTIERSYGPAVKFVITLDHVFTGLESAHGEQCAQVDLTGRVALEGRPPMPGVSLDITESEVTGHVDFGTESRTVRQASFEQRLLLEFSQGGRSAEQRLNVNVELRRLDGES